MNALRDFLRIETLAGLALVAAAALALALDNTGLSRFYDALLDVPLAIQVGDSGLAKPLVLWINDGLMAIFFLLVGLELKREAKEGELAEGGRLLLPLAAAIGGMAAPALIYAAVNAGDPVALRGWAIPSATDIAFTLAVLALLGSRVPLALKVLVTAIAIFDDVGAIAIIAVFYTADLSMLSLALAGAGLVVLLALNLAGVSRITPYVLVGVFLWVCVLKSGIHATLAGVAVGLAIPLHGRGGGHSPLRDLEHRLHPWVAFAIVPLFGFANAGVTFAEMPSGALFEGVPLGTLLGLFVGKPVGVMLGMVLIVRLGLASLPEGVTWRMVLGGAMLCGIGFTMSLFIGLLAFEGAVAPAGAADYPSAMRLGVLAGSLLSAVLGFLVLRAVAKPQPA